jgi:hypothetical protein
MKMPDGCLMPASPAPPTCSYYRRTGAPLRKRDFLAIAWSQRLLATEGAQGGRTKIFPTCEILRRSIFK